MSESSSSEPANISELLRNLRDSYVSKENLESFGDQLFNRITSELTHQFAAMSIDDKPKFKGKQPLQQILPELSEEAAENGQKIGNIEILSTANSTVHDLDNDVIMKSNFKFNNNNLTQVPEPGFFNGDTSETELFCELCEATFKTYPNNTWPEDAKVNFVKTRLRNAARNWYLTKYKKNTAPATMKELLNGLKESFNNIGNLKLAKIKLISLKQEYNNINNYIEEFRNLTHKFGLEEEALALLFYNGLHSRYQEEIQKLEDFPVTLESIITKCILFENTMKNKSKIKEATGKNFRNKSNKNYSKNYKNYKKNYKNNNYNNYNYNKSNTQQKYDNNGEGNVKAQKINSKN